MERLKPCAPFNVESSALSVVSESAGSVILLFNSGACTSPLSVFSSSAFSSFVSVLPFPSEELPELSELPEESEPELPAPDPPLAAPALSDAYSEEPPDDAVLLPDDAVTIVAFISVLFPAL